MGKNIVGPFYSYLTKELLLSFGTCFDEYLNMKGSPNHNDLAKELLRADPDLKKALFEMFWQMFTWKKKPAEAHIRTFMKIPLSKMPLYIIEFPDPIKRPAFCPPPIPGKGPLYWQVVFSRWRLINSL
jgi:hypothetical protein